MITCKNCEYEHESGVFHVCRECSRFYKDNFKQIEEEIKQIKPLQNSETKNTQIGLNRNKIHELVNTMNELLYKMNKRDLLN